MYLAGQVDSYFAVLTRITLASLVFLPFLFSQRVEPRFAAKLMAIGGLQLGVMYLFYYQSFLLLSVPEVLIFTIFTPVYITIMHDILAKRFYPVYLLAALLAVLGAAIIRWEQLSGDFWLGFLMVQGANLSFGLGQVLYKFLLQQHPEQQLKQHNVFGWFYLGALVIAIIAWGLLGQPQYPTSTLQWGILLWLGLVASGIGFFLWNKGATQVNSGQLAIMNNMLIPAGLVVNLVIWNRDTDLLRLSLGSIVLVLGLWMVQSLQAKRG